MKPLHRFHRFLLFAISFVLSACSFAATGAPTPEPTSTPTATITSTPTLRPTATLTPTPFYEVQSGETITVKSGGFSFDLIKGYEITYKEGSAVFIQSKDERVGIYLFAYVRPSGEAISTVLKNNLDDVSAEHQDFVSTEPLRASEDGIDSISAEFTARDGIIPVQGSLRIFEPDHSKLLYFFIRAEGDQRWQREGQKVFELIRGSLKFFRITALDDCGQSQYPEYGQKPERPIPIGGGMNQSNSRVASYLDVLLGPHDEPISYYRLSETAQDFPGLVLYSVESRSVRKIYYFDIEHYEPLTAPMGMTCSAAFPDEP